MRKFIESVNNAIEGILHAAKTQRHLRYHLYAAAGILLVVYVLDIDRTDFLIISIAVILVLLSEMINTAVEYVVNMLSPEFSERARIAKDIAAGAVFITACGAVLIGYILLSPYFGKLFRTGLYGAKYESGEVAVLSIIVVLISIVVLKSYFGKGHPLRGGMPSGHAAFAFSVWVAVTYMTENFYASLFCFILAVIIAWSRVTTRAHRPLEVVVGAILGAGITFLLFKIFH